MSENECSANRIALCLSGGGFLNEVRYSGGNQRAAQELAEALNKSGLPKATVQAKKLDTIENKVLEVWISR